MSFAKQSQNRSQNRVLQYEKKLFELHAISKNIRTFALE